MSSFAPLGVERDGDTVRITMNRPEQRNALAADHLLYGLVLNEFHRRSRE